MTDNTSETKVSPRNTGRLSLLDIHTRMLDSYSPSPGPIQQFPRPVESRNFTINVLPGTIPDSRAKYLSKFDLNTDRDVA